MFSGIIKEVGTLLEAERCALCIRGGRILTAPAGPMEIVDACEEYTIIGGRAVDERARESLLP